MSGFLARFLRENQIISWPPTYANILTALWLDPAVRYFTLHNSCEHRERPKRKPQESAGKSIFPQARPTDACKVQFSKILGSFIPPLSYSLKVELVGCSEFGFQAQLSFTVLFILCLFNIFKNHRII